MNKTPRGYQQVIRDDSKDWPRLRLFQLDEEPNLYMENGCLSMHLVGGFNPSEKY